jgi:hypothetical protein
MLACKVVISLPYLTLCMIKQAKLTRLILSKNKSLVKLSIRSNQDSNWQKINKKTDTNVRVWTLAF